MEISDLKAQLAKLEAAALPKSEHPWMSRKLLVALVVGGILVFFAFSRTGETIVAGLTWIAVAYLFAQAIPDAVKEYARGKEASAKREWDARVKIAEIEALAKDGLDEGDKERVRALDKAER